MEESDPSSAAESPPVPATPQRRVRTRWAGSVLSLFFMLCLIALALGVAGMALTGRSLPLPVWAVAEIEDRLNDRLSGTHLPPGASLSVGQIDLALDADLAPRLRLSDLRLLGEEGEAILALPEVAVALDRTELLRGRMRPTSVRLLGAHLEARRDPDGKIGLSLGGLSGARQPGGLAEMLDQLDRMFSTPALSGLTLVEADALTLTLRDERAGRVWQLGDGRLVIENNPEGLAADLGVTLLDGTRPTQARLTVQTEKSGSAARILANLQDMAAADLAAQAPPLAVLSVLDAPISGRMLGELDGTGKLKGFEGNLALGKGSIQPAGSTTPVAFDRAEIALRYDPARQRISLGSLRVESRSVRLRARGTVDLQDGAGGPAGAGQVPGAMVGQLAFSEVMVDPDGVFAEAVRFDTGALAVRVTLKPFRVEVGELTLGEGQDRLVLSGDLAAAEPGWSGSLAVSVPRIDVDRLVRLWPVSVVPKTREWLATNVGQASLQDVDVGLRLTPGQPPRFALDYEFSDAEVRFIKSLPPVRDGRGRATIYDNTYTIVLDAGHVTAPNGGRIDAAGSVMKVLDIAKFPADAEVRLTTVSPLTAALSLLDQEPFRFLSKAGREVDLGEGEARLTSTLRFPLTAKIAVSDISYKVAGTVVDFRSDRLVKGRVIKVPALAVSVTSKGLELAGKGSFEGVPFDAQLSQPFGAAAGGQTRVTADVRLSDKGLRALGVALPEGWLRGEAGAEVRIDIPKSGPVGLELTSSLTGAELSIPPLGWRKSKDGKAALALTARLGAQPEITKLTLKGAGLRAEGRLTTTASGAMDQLVLTTLQAGDWLDASAVIKGRGKSKPVAVEITDGSLDLRLMPKGEASGNAAETAMDVSLDQLIVSSGITLTGLQGSFMARKGGLDGGFRAAVNGQGRIDGAVVPDRGRTAVRISSRDAGAVMAAAGIFDKGRGGRLELTLSPRGPEGQYVGIAAFSGLSVQDAPSLAALLGAISVVGLLEQMSGSGLVFDDGDVEFVLNPDGVQITKGAAVGLSLGISFEGAYSSRSGKLDMQGVISPIYLLNGIGQIFARKGEGLFGFNYRLSGAAADPSVSIDPLSILTPGMFREIFRRPAPQLRNGG